MTQNLGELLVERGKLEPDKLQQARRLERDSGERLGPLLVQLGMLAERDLAEILAEQLIDFSSDGPLDEGLRMELDHLEEIFSTADAYEGLSSLGSRKPSFQGS